MKKISIIVLTIILVLFTSACTKTPDYSNRISQLRSNILVGETENISILCYAEEREQPYIADGNVDDKVFVLVFKLIAKSQLTENLTCKFISEQEYSFEAQKTDLDYGYVESVIVDKLPNENLDIYINDQCVTLTAIDTTNCITDKDALQSVIKKNSQIFENIDCTEIHIRLISENASIFWYVGVVNKENTNAFLVDGKTAEVIAEKVIKNSN